MDDVAKQTIDYNGFKVEVTKSKTLEEGGAKKVIFAFAFPANFDFSNEDAVKSITAKAMSSKQKRKARWVRPTEPERIKRGKARIRCFF